MAKKKKVESNPLTKMDDALESSKKTESALLDMLTKFQESEGFYRREAVQKDETFDPQLSFEQPAEIVTEEYSNVAEPPNLLDSETSLPPPVAPSLPISTTEIYSKLEEFFTYFINSYDARYNQWENSISNILAILRKMRKITKANTEDLVLNINSLYGKVQDGLGQFKVKRAEIERVAEVDVQTMSSEFKRVLGLLELQIKEYQLKMLSDEYIRDKRIFST